MPIAMSAMNTSATRPATTMPKIVKALDMGDPYPRLGDDGLKACFLGLGPNFLV